MAERIELIFEGDENDARMSGEAMVRILDRIEKSGYQAGRALDSLDVDLEDDIRQVQRMERAMAQLNREMMKNAGLRWMPGGAGGGGHWGPSQLALPAGPIRAGAAPDASYVRAVPASFGRYDYTSPPLSGRNMRDSDIMGDVLAHAVLGSFASRRRRATDFPDFNFGGFSTIGGGGGGRRTRIPGSGFFSYGENDTSLQAGDLFRGILPGGTRQSVGAVGTIAAGAVGLGGAAAPGIAGGAVAGGAFLQALGTNIAAVAIAMRGLGDAIDGDYEAFQKLTPAAKEFVQEIRSFIPYMDKLREIAGEGIWDGMARGLNALLSDDFMRNLEGGLGQVGDAIGDSLAELGTFLGSPEMAERFGTFLQESTTWTEDFTDATISLVDAWTKLVDASYPFIEWMSGGIADGAAWIQQWIDAEVAAGEWADTLERGQDAIRDFGDFAGSLLGVLKALADLLDGPALNALDLAGDAFDELAQTIDENREEIEAFINGGINALADTVRALWPVLETLLELINDIAEAIGGWEVAFEIIITGLLFRSVMDLTKAFGGLIGVEAAAGGTGLLGAKAAAVGLVAQLARAVTLGSALVYIVNQLNDSGKNPVPGWLDRNGLGWLSDSAKWLGDHLPGSMLFPPGADTGAGKAQDPSSATGVPTSSGRAAGPGGGVDTKGGARKTLPDTFSSTHQTSGLEGYPAVDVFFEANQPVGAPADGVITSLAWNKTQDFKRGFGGWNMYLKADKGGTYFITHLMDPTVKVGDHVTRGQVIGYAAGKAIGGGIHIHLGYNASGGSGPSGASGTPPPFDKNVPSSTPKEPPSGSELLTQAERQALTRVERTPGPGDDIEVLGGIIERLTGLSKRKRGKAKTYIEEEITALTKMLDDAISEKWDEWWAKRPQKSETWGALAEAFGVTGQAGKDIVAEANRIADRMLDEIEKERKALVDAYEDLARDAAKAFFEAFDAETAAWVSPTRAIINAEREAKQTADLSRRLAEAEKALEEARKGREVSNADENLRKIAQLVAQYNLADSIDKVQAGILGIAHVDAYDQEFANRISALAQPDSARIVDYDAIAQAEQRVADIKFEIRMNELEKVAAAEEAAYQAERERLRAHLEQQLVIWQAYFSNLVATKSATPAQAAFGLGIAMQNLSQGKDPFTPTLFTSPVGTDWSGLKAIGLAEGGFVTGPTLAVVGERGREAVIPLDHPSAQGALGGDTHVNVIVEDGAMEWLKGFVRVEVADSSDMISSQMGREVSRRAREGRY